MPKKWLIDQKQAKCLSKLLFQTLISLTWLVAAMEKKFKKKRSWKRLFINRSKHLISAIENMLKSNKQNSMANPNKRTFCVASETTSLFSLPVNGDFIREAMAIQTIPDRELAGCLFSLQVQHSSYQGKFNLAQRSNTDQNKASQLHYSQSINISNSTLKWYFGNLCQNGIPWNSTIWRSTSYEKLDQKFKIVKTK